jgi:hypothetical protein
MSNGVNLLILILLNTGGHFFRIIFSTKLLRDSENEWIFLHLFIIFS